MKLWEKDGIVRVSKKKTATQRLGIEVHPNKNYTQNLFCFKGWLGDISSTNINLWSQFLI